MTRALSSTLIAEHQQRFRQLREHLNPEAHVDGGLFGSADPRLHPSEAARPLQGATMVEQASRTAYQKVMGLDEARSGAEALKRLTEETGMLSPLTAETRKVLADLRSSFAKVDLADTILKAIEGGALSEEQVRAIVQRMDVLERCLVGDTLLMREFPHEVAGALARAMVELDQRFGDFLDNEKSVALLTGLLEGAREETGSHGARLSELTRSPIREGAREALTFSLLALSQLTSMPYMLPDLRAAGREVRTGGEPIRELSREEQGKLARMIGEYRANELRHYEDCIASAQHALEREQAMRGSRDASWPPAVGHLGASDGLVQVSLPMGGLGDPTFQAVDRAAMEGLLLELRHSNIDRADRMLQAVERGVVTSDDLRALDRLALEANAVQDDLTALHRRLRSSGYFGGVAIELRLPSWGPDMYQLKQWQRDAAQATFNKLAGALENAMGSSGSAPPQRGIPGGER